MAEAIPRPARPILPRAAGRQLPDRLDHFFYRFFLRRRRQFPDRLDHFFLGRRRGHSPTGSLADSSSGNGGGNSPSGSPILPRGRAKGNSPAGATTSSSILPRRRRQLRLVLSILPRATAGSAFFPEEARPILPRAAGQLPDRLDWLLPRATGAATPLPAPIRLPCPRGRKLPGSEGRQKLIRR